MPGGRRRQHEEIVDGAGQPLLSFIRPGQRLANCQSRSGSDPVNVALGDGVGADGGHDLPGLVLSSASCTPAGVVGEPDRACGRRCGPGGRRTGSPRPSRRRRRGPSRRPAGGRRPDQPIGAGVDASDGARSRGRARPRAAVEDPDGSGSRREGMTPRGTPCPRSTMPSTSGTCGDRRSAQRRAAARAPEGVRRGGVGAGALSFNIDLVRHGPSHLLVFKRAGGVSSNA